MHGRCSGVSCYWHTWRCGCLAEPRQVLASSSSPCWSLVSLTEGSRLRNWKFSPFHIFLRHTGICLQLSSKPPGQNNTTKGYSSALYPHLYPKAPSSYLLWVCRNKFIFLKAFLQFLIFLMRLSFDENITSQSTPFLSKYPVIFYDSLSTFILCFHQEWEGCQAEVINVLIYVGR